MKITMGKVLAFFSIFTAFFVFQYAAIADEINIGISGPLTGPAAYIGIDSLHGAQIAAKELNDAGGVIVGGKKYTINIHSYDDEGVAAKAVAGMQRLKDKYNTPVIIQNISASIMGCLEKNEKMGVLVAGFFVHPEATNRGNKLVLRHNITALEEARTMIEGVYKYWKPKTYALLVDVGDYGKPYVRVSEEVLDKRGVKLVAKEWLDMRTQTDFRGQLTKIKAADPDVIIIAAYDEATAGAIKQAHELGIKTRIGLSTGFQSGGVKLTGPVLIEGYLKMLQPHSTDPPNPATARYREELYPKMGFKEPAGPYGQNVYQCTHTLIQAMIKAGTTTDALKIRQAAPSVVPLPVKWNAVGVQAFKENGDAIVGNFVGVYRSGKLVKID